jgi:hypothetical protein
MLALVAAAFLGSPAQPPVSGAVVIADYAKGAWDFDDCPADSICMRFPYRTRFKVREQIAGLAVSKHFDGTLYMHGEMKRRRLALLVETASDGWHVVAWSLPSHRCFNAEQVMRLGLATVGRLTDDDHICFPPSS